MRSSSGGCSDLPLSSPSHLVTLLQRKRNAQDEPTPMENQSEEHGWPLLREVSFQHNVFPSYSPRRCTNGPCACSGFSLLGRVPGCTPYFQGQSTFSTYQVQGVRENPGSGSRRPSWGTILVCLLSCFVILAEQPACLILWETLCSSLREL